MILAYETFDDDGFMNTVFVNLDNVKAFKINSECGDKKRCDINIEFINGDNVEAGFETNKGDCHRIIEDHIMRELDRHKPICYLTMPEPGTDTFIDFDTYYANTSETIVFEFPGTRFITHKEYEDSFPGAGKEE